MAKVDYSMTYWCGAGKFQLLHDRLFADLVPARGGADTYHGEVLRCACRLYYDAYNNGCGNFDALDPHRRFVLAFLEWNGLPVPGWLRTLWGEPEDRDAFDDKDYLTGPEFTQQLVDELEALLNHVILFATLQQGWRYANLNEDGRLVAYWPDRSTADTFADANGTMCVVDLNVEFARCLDSC